MSRNTYILVITLLFSLVYIPHLINTILFSVLDTDPINFTMIPKNNLKMLVLVLISFMESTFIKKQYPGILSWILSAVLIIAIAIRVMRWPYNTETIIISTVVLLGNLIYFAIQEKNKTVVNYVLMGYVLIRVLVLIFKHNDFLWWIEFIIGSCIVILGIRYSITLGKAVL
ncbi:hypothetical protein M0D21_00770 [Aquimarina sp. D1M17]|uniref:hypothetical protein n=1 Tax=Aquimarina acroporae TaxID=2937283 RepID=UPI0020C08CFE|nr:hypothetical protein [Aquimarina acroporae]MCK8520082.1 hypothetical protein [Aquimarina acroporae]